MRVAPSVIRYFFHFAGIAGFVLGLFMVAARAPQAFRFFPLDLVVVTGRVALLFGVAARTHQSIHKGTRPADFFPSPEVSGGKVNIASFFDVSAAAFTVRRPVTDHVVSSMR
jgi:hypothetical protein